MCILYIIFFSGFKYNKHWIIPGDCVTFVVVMYYRHSYKRNKTFMLKITKLLWHDLWVILYSFQYSQSVLVYTVYNIIHRHTIELHNYASFRFHRDLKESRCHSLFIEIFMHFLSITCIMRCININLGRISST
jgi:hypothetical protein